MGDDRYTVLGTNGHGSDDIFGRYSENHRIRRHGADMRLAPAMLVAYRLCRGIGRAKTFDQGQMPCFMMRLRHID